MADKSGIEWTEATWNPTTGCDRISPGCDNCYALTLAGRLKAMGSAKYQRDGDPRTSGPGFALTAHPDALTLPLRWRSPRRVFVNSMSDLFHNGVPDEFIARVFAVMSVTPRHTYQILTKRHARMRSLLNSHRFWTQFAIEFVELRKDLEPVSYNADGPHLTNVWLGVSVENQQWADIRVPALLGTPAAVRWLSCEPLLGPVNLQPDDHSTHARDYDGDYVCLDCSTDDHRVPWRTQEFPPIDWVVVGGESGPGARPMHPNWARSLCDQCTGAGVPFFFKQWGGRTPKSGGRALDGRTWDEYPRALARAGGDS